MKSETRVKCDVKALTAKITQVGERAAKGISDAMHYYAEVILRDAIMNAPHDTGSLERALYIEQDYGGVNGRLRIKVLLDKDAPYISENPNHKVSDKTVGDYAMLMERYLAPYGSGRYDARQGTLDKGPQAGGRFFDRAVKEHINALIARARNIANKAARI